MSRKNTERPEASSGRRPAGKRGPKPAGKKPAPANVSRPASPPSRDLVVNPRLVAFRVLKETSEGHLPEEVLAVQGLLLEPRDLGLATALIYEVLRHRGYLEWLMHSRLSAGRAAPELALVLKMGLAQLLFFDRLGEHAVVSETVALAKAVTPGRAGLVNAVLRGLLRDREAGAPWPPSPPVDPDPVRDLARRHSYPEWLVRTLLDRLGPEEAPALLAAGNQATPPTLRVNPLRGDRDSLRALLPFETTPTSWSPWGLIAASFAGRPETWPGYAEGRFAIQDEASQLVGLLAGELRPGAAVLDACAGLGGKALHLAALHPEALITALDQDEARLALLQREAERLGCANVRVEVRDLLADPPAANGYDLVLVDAPCTGLGVIRRRPDLKWNKTEADPARLAERQLAILNAASGAVRPGGRLIYGVCSFSPEEGPGVVKRFLERAPGFQAVPSEDWPEALRPLLSAENTLTLWPHRHGTDGFFWAMFSKKS